MDRASFIRSLFVVAAAPKIIGELDLTTKAVVEHKQVVEGFMGIIPYIQKHGITVPYESGKSITMAQIHEWANRLPRHEYHLIHDFNYKN